MQIPIRTALAVLASCAAVLTAGCGPAPSPEPSASPTPGVTLTPFVPGPAPEFDTATPTAVRTPTPLPTPTPTPFIYTIVEGDTLLAVAFRFGLTLAELLVANPGIDPQFLRIGDPLFIPLPENAGTVAGQPTPVAAAVPAPAVACWPAADGSLWCFWTITNTGEQAVEALSAQFTIYDDEGEVLAVKTGVSPLNLVPPGGRVPVAAWFPEAGGFSQASAVLLSAIPLAAGDPRYLAAAAEFEVVLEGVRASAAGIIVPEDSGMQGAARVVLVAYDRFGQVVGVRILEPEPSAVSGGLSFSGLVYSLAGEIAAVEVLFELLAVSPLE